MATLNLTGLETGDLTEFGGSAGTLSVVSSGHRSGQYGLRCNPASSAAGSAFINGLNASGQGAAFGRTAQTFYTVYFRFPTLPSGTVRFMRVESSTPAAVVRFDCTSGGLITMVGSTTSATIATISANVWYRIDFRITSNATSFASIDGGTEQSCTANNITQDRLRLGRSETTEAVAFDCYYDDVFISDSAFPGAGLVSRLDVTGAGNVANWTTGTGTTFAECDDDVPGHDSDTTYIASATNGVAHTFACEDGAGVGVAGLIKSVKSYAMNRTDSTAGASSMFSRLRVGSSNSDTNALEITTSYSAYQKINDTDPSTGAAWTSAGVDGILVGVVTGNVAQTQRCTKLCAMVWSAGISYGTLAQTLGALTVDGDGVVRVVGTLSKTLAALTVDGDGRVWARGALSQTLGALTVDADGAVRVAGTLSKTLGTLTVDADGVVRVAGTLTKTLAALTVDADGVVRVVGTLAQTLGALTVDADGVVRIVGTLSKTLGALLADADGAVWVRGALTQTLADLLVAGEGTVEDAEEAGISGELAQTLADLTLLAEGDVWVRGALAQTLASIIIDADGKVLSRGILAQTLAALTVDADGKVLTRGQLARTLDALLADADGRVWVRGALSQTLGALTVSGAGSVRLQGELEQTLAAVTLLGTGVVGTIFLGILNQTLAPLALSGLGTVTAAATGGKTHMRIVEFPVEPEDEEELLLLGYAATRDNVYAI